MQYNKVYMYIMEDKMEISFIKDFYLQCLIEYNYCTFCEVLSHENKNTKIK